MTRQGHPVLAHSTGQRLLDLGQSSCVQSARGLVRLLQRRKVLDLDQALGLAFPCSKYNGVNGVDV